MLTRVVVAGSLTLLLPQQFAVHVPQPPVARFRQTYVTSDESKTESWFLSSETT